jgi:DNA-binding beta-propeller fold protein YncE
MKPRNTHRPETSAGWVSRSEYGRGWLVILAFVLVSVACGVGAPGALASRGHVFSSTFGEAGVGDGQFSAPSAVAADEADGLIYVSDTGNNRVEVFRRGGGGAIEYVSQFAVRDPGPLAVDNSSNASDPSRGEVYVAGAGSKEEQEEGERDTLYVYSSAAGEVTHKVHAFKFKEKGGEELEEEFEEDISGVSVDANGVLWVYWEEGGIVDGFSKAVSGGGKSKLEWRPGLRRSMEERFECRARAAFAVAPDASAFYVGYERRDEAERCPGEEEGGTPDPTVVAKLDDAAPVPSTLIAEIDHRDTTGAAVDSSDGDVYLDGGSSVGAYTPDGVPIQRFGEGDLTSGSGVAVDSATGEVLVADVSADRVVVFGGEGTAAKPVVDDVSSQNVTPRSAELRAQIDPRGLETTYRFEWGTRDCRESGAECASSAAQKIAAGFGDTSVSVPVGDLQPASAYYVRVVASNDDGESEGVALPTTFSTLPSPSVLPDGRGWELVSPPNKHGSTVTTMTGQRAGAFEASADGSRLAWLAAGPVVSEPEGNRAFELSQLMSVRGGEGWDTYSLETPHANGWGLLVPSPGEYYLFSPDLSTALLAPTEYDEGKTEGVVEHPPLSPEASEKTIYLRQDLPAQAPDFSPLVTAHNDTAGTQFGGALDLAGASEDLSHVVFHSKVALTSEHPSTAGLYMWQAGRPLALVSVLPGGEPAPDGELVEPTLGAFEGMSARNAVSHDGNLVFWTDGTGSALYMRDMALDRTIRVNAAQGQEATEPGPGGHTLSEPPAEQPEREVRFQSASSDGSRVFFTDTARLTEDSNQEPTGSESSADLYEFELTGEDPLRGRLIDVSAGAPDASADVLNVIPGSSQDGSEVYFVANGVLAPGASPGRCARDLNESEPSPPGATCNLYVSEAVAGHPGERQVRFIAALSAEDGADWGAGATSELRPSQLNLSSVTSRVSPDGRYLAFMSQESLTGYDNRDAVSGEPDEETYLYDAATGRLTCVSCDGGEGQGGGWVRPSGVLDIEHSGEGVGLLVDRSQIWDGRWLSGSIPGWTFNINGNAAPLALYQPRYLADSGRLFFDSADALVSQDTNGKEDVYEYEPQGVGTCQSSAGCTGLISSGTSDRESAFLDASESGDDVFFMTASPLVAADKDQSLDIYDAHVCTSVSPCLQYPGGSTTPCETSSECRPGNVTAPSTSPPPTATYTGPGNPTPAAKQTVSATKKAAKPTTRKLTRTQELAKALQACRVRYKHAKNKRHLCERQARAKYTPHKHSTSKERAASSAHPSSHANRPVTTGSRG